MEILCCWIFVFSLQVEYLFSVFTVKYSMPNCYILCYISLIYLLLYYYFFSKVMIFQPKHLWCFINITRNWRSKYLVLTVLSTADGYTPSAATEAYTQSFCRLVDLCARLILVDIWLQKFCAKIYIKVLGLRVKKNKTVYKAFIWFSQACNVMLCNICVKNNILYIYLFIVSIILL